MLSSGSSNHNQNRYQAVVSTCAHTFVYFVFYFCVCRQQGFFLTVSPGGASRRSHSALNVVLSSSCQYHLLPFCVLCLMLYNRPPVILQTFPIILLLLFVPSPTAPEGGEPEAPPEGRLEQLQHTGGP